MSGFELFVLPKALKRAVVTCVQEVHCWQSGTEGARIWGVLLAG